MQRDGRFVKGWGVRSPDFIPRGSFVCEYIGEYISDDEAESRGIRYDNQKMSRLMDVYGDGKDTVRMCIDATKFSNLGTPPRRPRSKHARARASPPALRARVPPPVAPYYCTAHHPLRNIFPLRPG